MLNNDPELEALIKELAAVDFGDLVWIGPSTEQPSDATARARLALEQMLGFILVEELACHEKIYDQNRYDAVYEILNRLFGWSRVKLHQNVLERKSLGHSHPNFRISKPLRELISPQQKVILAQVVDKVVLKDLTETEFVKYLQNRIALELGLAV